MKTIGLLLVAVLGIAGPAVAKADNYPNKPVRILVGFPPGQSTDELARRLAKRLSESMGQAFVVENRPGSGAGLAPELVARADPDGYTLLASSSGPLTINPWIYKDLRYDARRDLAPVASLSIGSLVLVVKADSPYQTAQDLIAAAKAQPGVLNYGSGGNGVTNHLVMEMLKDATDTNIQHVPYKGGVAALNDLIGGQINTMFEVTSVAEPMIKQGRLRALAVSGRARVNTLPDIPTLEELGYGVRGEPWAGLLAPAKTPPQILDRLHAEIEKISQSPEWLADTARGGGTVLNMSRQDFAGFIDAEIGRWGDAVKKGNVQMN